MITLELCDEGIALPDNQVAEWTKQMVESAEERVVKFANALALTWFQVHIKENPALLSKVRFIIYGREVSFDKNGLSDSAWRHWASSQDLAFTRLFDF